MQYDVGLYSMSAVWLFWLNMLRRLCACVWSLGDRSGRRGYSFERVRSSRPRDRVPLQPWFRSSIQTSFPGVCSQSVPLADLAMAAQRPRSRLCWQSWQPTRTRCRSQYNYYVFLLNLHNPAHWKAHEAQNWHDGSTSHRYTVNLFLEVKRSKVKVTGRLMLS